MQKVFAFLLLLGFLVSAQTVPAASLPGLSAVFPPRLKAYLDLTDDQIAKINDLNSQLTSVQTSKAVRQAQVQSEITQETAKVSLDAMALGVRYLELEALRRDIQAETQKTFEGIQAVLTTAQKAKLTALQDALRLYWTSCDAANQNLLPASGPTLAGQADNSFTLPANTAFSITWFLGAPPFPLNYGTCVPTNAVPTGILILTP